jgi:hypothetical protein
VSEDPNPESQPSGSTLEDLWNMGKLRPIADVHQQLILGLQRERNSLRAQLKATLEALKQVDAE